MRWLVVWLLDSRSVVYFVLSSEGGEKKEGVVNIFGLAVTGRAVALILICMSFRYMLSRFSARSVEEMVVAKLGGMV